ncbi:MAG TPA: transcription termination factor NusA [Limnochordia bacterium]|nr:transcription termination factor NusA [Limnochordia bacterium]
MNLELVGALNELERERGISKEILLEAIEAAIISAYKRNDQAAQNVRVEISEKSGKIQVFAQKQVVEEVVDPANEISVEAARAINPNYSAGDVVEIEVTPRDFGRIAAQTAKQVVIQRIREAERAIVYEEYANREGDVVTGIVQRSDHKNVLVDLGRVEAILPPSEQMPKETYTHGARIKVYISEVRQTTKGPQVIVSRSHPGLLKRLFELEVPEIHEGIVEIRAVAREAGNRSKIAVSSRDPNVDPVGACVGPRGMRVQAIVQELKGEKIDIIEYSADPERFVANALSPARVVRVYINEDEKSARAVVPDHQLSLAIGREGQNARLAARLTGWKIDIKSESQMAELALLEAQRMLEARSLAQAVAEEEAEAPATVADVEPSAVEGDAPAAVAAGGPAAGVGVEPEEVAVEEEAAALAQDQPGEAVVDEATAGAAAEAETLDVDLEIPDDLFEELEEEREKMETAAPKVKKGRAARKELQTMIEEELDEEEPLPSLFDGDDEDDSEEPAVFVVDGGRSEPAPKRESQPPKFKPATGKKDKEKVVLKDFSQLAALLGSAGDEEEEKES